MLPFGLLGEFTRRYPAETPKKAEGEGYRHLDVKAGAGQRRRPPKRPALVLPAVEVFPGDARAALTARLQRLDLVGEIPHGAGSVALLHVNEATATRARVAIRLSFETDRLVFPYDEPRDVGADARRLVAWVVSETPVELLARAGDGIVSRPWRAGVRHRATRSAVRAALGRFKTRLPGQGSLWIQTFGEQKADRRGYGPILAVPDTWLGTSGDGVVHSPLPTLAPEEDQGPEAHLCPFLQQRPQTRFEVLVDRRLRHDSLNPSFGPRPNTLDYVHTPDARRIQDAIRQPASINSM